MTAEEKLEQIVAIIRDPMGGVTDDRYAEIARVLDGPEEGEVARIDVGHAMPPPQMAVFATSLEIGSVEHDDLGIILELAFDIAGGGYCKVMVAAEVGPHLATAIVDAKAAAEQASEQGRIEKVAGKLWTPDER